MTLMEQRIILCVIAQLNSLSIKNARSYIVDRESFQSLFSVTLNARDMRKTSTLLMSRVLDIKHGRHDKSGVLIHWVNRIKYDENGVHIMLSEDIMPYIEGLKERFSKMPLGAVANISSFYAYRIYDLINQYRNHGSRVISVDDLRSNLKLDGKYLKFAEFKRRVLIVSLNQLNQYSDMNIDLKYIRKGRSIDKLAFTFSEKELFAQPNIDHIKDADQIKPNRHYVMMLHKKITRLLEDIRVGIHDVIVKGKVVDRDRSKLSVPDIIFFKDGSQINVSELR